MPRRLENGERNNYRIARLKDKFGTRSMASGEVVLEGAIAYQLGALDRGLRQMMDMVNLSRMSHGARAAGMMRRCLNESIQVARHRAAFGRPIIEHPLLRRQLMKLMVRTEQALSVFTYDAAMMDRARAGDAEAERVMRILTAVLKFRACRDNIRWRPARWRCAAATVTSRIGPTRASFATRISACCGRAPAISTRST